MAEKKITLPDGAEFSLKYDELLVFEKLLIYTGYPENQKATELMLTTARHLEERAKGWKEHLASDPGQCPV